MKTKYLDSLLLCMFFLRRSNGTLQLVSRRQLCYTQIKLETKHDLFGNLFNISPNALIWVSVPAERWTNIESDVNSTSSNIKNTTLRRWHISEYINHKLSDGTAEPDTDRKVKLEYPATSNVKFFCHGLRYLMCRPVLRCFKLTHVMPGLHRKLQRNPNHTFQLFCTWLHNMPKRLSPLRARAGYISYRVTTVRNADFASWFTANISAMFNVFSVNTWA